MKFRFEPNLDYQLQAIDAVCDLFRGEEICRTEFTVTKSALNGEYLPGLESDLGIGNRTTLLDDEILKNLKDVQLRNGLAPSEQLGPYNFTVEMETGTGKTYVYLRTAFELHQRFGFTKFVIVVPSVAIKEGVYKTLQMTEQHFRQLYAGVPFEYFIYDSSKLGQVRNFATSPNIQFMMMTVGAINKKDVNNLYKDSEKTGGEKPIDLVRATNAIVIVDEPQSVDGGLAGQGKKALDEMKPLCTLRYSATHVNKYNMVYRLDAVDAYERKLVKQIEVASATVVGAHNRPYVRLLSASNKRGMISAIVELDVKSGNGVQRSHTTVQDGDDLEMTTGRAVYRDCRVGEIRVGRGKESLELHVPGDDITLQVGESYGDVDALAVQREMIRRTIKEHLDKEKRLRPQGIKVLSLFFVDTVGKYRQYDQDGNPVKGDYALIFEEEYRRFASDPEYATLFGEADMAHTAEEVHGGYFSIDRHKVGGKIVEELADTGGDTKADDDTYSLIMRDKERLLSLGTPLKFIFSHSALREGWDNPNIFQICALRDIQTERERRQTIGRGLRLCVNQNGDRQRGFDVNTLTVVAMESYEQFAANLQREIETDTGIRFGILESHQFAGVVVPAVDGTSHLLGLDQSKELFAYLQEQGYIATNGKVEDALKKALKDNTFAVPPQFADQIGQIREILRKVSGRLEIKNADERRQVRVREATLQSAEFKALWDRIKYKTTYRVHFDNEQLIESCTLGLQEAPPIARARLIWNVAKIGIGEGGVEATEKDGAANIALDDRRVELPDLLTYLQNQTELTRRSLVRILIDSRRLNDFKRNPQQFTEIAAEVINSAKRLLLVGGIKYQRIGDQDYYAQELFETEELTGYLRNLFTTSSKSVYEQVVYDADTEARFADQLEKNSSVKVYTKLPGWFTVPTPLGTYNPDWAILADIGAGERLYLVVETKSSLLFDELRDRERAKIKCGKAHFSALATGDDPARFVTAVTLEDALTSGDDTPMVR